MTWPLWWWWSLPLPPKPQKRTSEEQRQIDVDELARAWCEHLRSTKVVAERAAKNVSDAERLTQDLKVLIAKERDQKQGD
jgi:hypothetical protein